MFFFSKKGFFSSISEVAHKSKNWLTERSKVETKFILSFRIKEKKLLKTLIRR